MKNTKLETLKNKIAELESTIFLLDMVDHWTREQSELADKYNKELINLKELVIEELTKQND